jgi:bifunctional non-homologous end joining protein LigD
MSAVSTTLPSASLAFQDGRSDKVYQAEVVPATNGAGFIVRFAYGRRGAALTAGVKTNAPVSLDAATKVFDKLVAEKRAKGYRDLDASGTIAAPVVAAAAQGIATPPRMQPTAATEAEGESFITDPQYAIQQKFDGRALTIVKQGDRIVGFNKLKQPTAIPAEAHAVLAAVSIDLTLDGEAFADHVVAYDVSAAQGLHRTLRNRRRSALRLHCVHDRAEAGARRAVESG